MKKAAAFLSAVFCGIILFFSVMGERLYYSTKPNVEIDRPICINDLIFLPETAVFHEPDGDFIFTVESEQGFSAKIMTVTKIRLDSCEPDETGYLGEGYVAVRAEGYTNAPTVVSTDRKLRDGQRVWEEG